MKTEALDRLGFGVAPDGAGTYEAVATVLGSREPDGAERAVLAEALATRLLVAAIVGADGERPSRYTEAAIDYSDDAECENPNGETGSAFVAGKRCYRIVMQVAAVRPA